MDISHDALYYALYSDLAPFLRGKGTTEAPPPEAGPRTFAAYTALNSSLSKLLVDGEVTQAQKDKAQEKFLGVNRACGDWVYDPKDMHEEYLFGELREEFYRALVGDWGDPIFSWNAAVKCGAPGPGASAGVAQKDLYSKMWDSRVTTSSEYLYMMYRDGISVNPNWKAANDWRAKVWGDYETVEASKQFFVAKNAQTARMAATEPSVNMYLQKGLGTLIERQLSKRYHINLSYQPVYNRALAKEGSRSGNFATIDLSSASDSISLGLLKKLLPREVLGYLLSTRSNKMRCEGGEVIELNMVSTMGNGFTFPLETLLFTCMVVASYKVAGIPLSLNRDDGKSPAISGNFAVFGDDIIVRHEAVGGLLKLLKLCGFATNGDKTFVEGPFRESCGGDFLNGEPVRSFYIKSLVTLEDTYVAINAAVEWSARFNIPLYNLVRLLVRLAKARLPARAGLHWVPGDYPEDSGIRVPHSILRDRTGKNRDGSLSIRFRRAMPQKVRLSYFNWSVASFELEVIRLVNPSGARYRSSVNTDGLYVSFLGGYVGGHGWSLSDRDPTYRNKLVRDPGNGAPTGLEVNQLLTWKTMADRLL